MPSAGKQLAREQGRNGLLPGLDQSDHEVQDLGVGADQHAAHTRCRARDGGHLVLEVLHDAGHPRDDSIK